MVVWLSSWAVAWRLLIPDGVCREEAAFPLARRVLPDGEVAALLAVGMIAELCLSVISPAGLLATVRGL